MYLREEVIMLKKEDYAVIKVLAEDGVYQKDIAEKLGVHPKTVSRALQREQCTREKPEEEGEQTGAIQSDH